MWTSSERNGILHIWAIEIEGRRVLEYIFVAICRRIHQGDRFAGRDRPPANGHIPRGGARKPSIGRVEAQKFIRRGRDQR